MTTDAIGQMLSVGDTVAIYGYFNDDGYNCDPELDTRCYGHIRTEKITVIGTGSAETECGAWWPFGELVRVGEDLL